MPEVPFARPDEQLGNAKTKLGRGLIYRFGPFELDVDRYELRRQGLRVRMVPAQMELLMLLVERRNTLVGRDDISVRLWQAPEMVDVDQGINTAVRRMREVLRDNPSAPRFVETVVGKGYRFIAEVSEILPEPVPTSASDHLLVSSEPEMVKETSTDTASALQDQEELTEPAAVVSQSPEAKKQKIERGVFAAVAILLTLGVVFAGWRMQRHPITHYGAAIAQITSNDSELRVTAAAISGDGKWIAYADLSGIWLQLLQSGKTVPLKAPEALRIDRIAWFGDQTKILASGFNARSNKPEIWTIFITGGPPQLFRGDARDGSLSPDGTRVAYTQNEDRELWTAGADGVGARLLVADPSGKALLAVFWSGDGRRISYLRSLNGLGKSVYLSADASTGKILASQTDVDFQSACSLSDGRVFYLSDSPARHGDEFYLWEVDTNRLTGAFVSSPVRVASLDRARAFGLSTSDDGARMTVVLEKGEPHVYEGALQQPGPSLADLHRLTFDTRTDYPDSWLHDNQTLLFESNRRGILKLYAQRLGERNAQELNTGADPSMLAQVTPDGKWILYVSGPDMVVSREARIFRLPATGGAAEEVAAGGPQFEFRCPLCGGSKCVLLNIEDQKWLVYYSLDPMTGKGHELARTAWLPHVLSDWTVSPDGSAVAVASHDPANPKIRIIPLNGGANNHERELAVRGFGKLSGISWSADGKGWYVAANMVSGASLLYVNQLGEPRVLHESPTSTWGVPSPDGRRLGFVDQSVDSNVWMWQIATRL